MDFTNDYYAFDSSFEPSDYSNGYSFEEFKKNYPNYLESLNNRIKLLYKTYDDIYHRRYAKISESSEHNETACRIGFGMLMRHTLEAISIDISLKRGIEVGGKSVYERLDALKGQIISGYSKETEIALFRTLDLTNEIAHPHVISEDEHLFEELCKHYQTSLKNIIEFYILHTDRRDIKKYLCALKKRMDNFSMRDKITRNLILGCLIRQLTECTVNLWCYNYKLPPTDISTAENQIGLRSALRTLGSIANEKRRTAFGSSAMTIEVVNTLFQLKNASNSLMHVTPESVKIRCIEQHGKTLRELYSSVISECSPDALEMKFNKTKQEKITLITTLLCGFCGWWGIHHFYSGNIAKGIMYLLFGGFIIGPIVSLKGILDGNFHTKKWGTLVKTRLTSFLSVVFIILHLILLYFIFFGR